ncbi:extracellular solute-binding protein family 1 [Aphanothece sacrum FPU1]|uniref:Extracellular solute-binding protein family 1 n=2 Tax=Aphanothece sacrum TaxID=1122 RepID=A0A401IDI6_APHSA|nr:extracellular solute-binding protein family 1 [Aphanothece sacrum FPU1]GBF86787.1 extracellular solute-binding protein family 3 [Aphanothece sacrum FPU3]
MSNKTHLMTKWPSIALSTLLLASSLTACGGGEKTTTTPTDSGTASPGSTGRLATIKQRGTLICGVDGKIPGFSFVDEKGQYSGLDVDMCKAIAAALFDDPTKVEYRKLSTQERFTAVQTGEVDILNRNTTWTISRDTSVGMEFAPTTFYDGQGMMVKKATGITKLEQLKGKSICVQAGTTSEQNLADQMRKRGIDDYKPVVSDDVDAVYTAYEQGRCEGVTSDRSQLVARRSIAPKPDDHLVLDVVMSKEPLGPVVANGDTPWFDAVKWITFATFQAEEFGITSQNLATFQTSKDPSIRRFLGLDDKLGEGAGLPNDFAARIVKHVGNYGEIYERNVGKPLGLDRGPNKLWSEGGLLYSPPFR